MASEYTPNRRYPLYTDLDKPNLRDQYNGAIREIDTDMKDSLDNSQRVSDAMGTGFSAEHTVAMAVENVVDSMGSGFSPSSTVAQQLAAERTARENGDTAINDKIGSGFSSSNTVAQQLAAERTARENADTAINNKIGSGFSSSSTVAQQLAAERTARENADTSERTAREDADTAINNKIGSGFSSSNTVAQKLTAEQTARENGDTAINDKIGSGFSSSSTVAQQLAAERTARTNGDSALSTEISKVLRHGKVCILIGDSYGEGYTPDGNVQGWCDVAATRLGGCGITAKTRAVGGASLANHGFYTNLQTAVNGMTAEEIDKCSLVIIGGGYNDRGSSLSDMYAGVSEICTYVKSHIPNARVIFTFIGRCVTGLTTGAHAGVSMNSVLSAAKNWFNACTQYGAGIDLNGIGCLSLNSNFSSDYVHPNASGQTRIANHVINLVNGVDFGEREFGDMYIQHAGIAGADGWTSVKGNTQLLVHVDEYGFARSFFFGSPTDPLIEFTSSGKSITFNHTYHHLGVLHHASLCGQNIYVPAIMVIRSQASGYYTASGSLMIADGGQLTFRAFMMNDAKNNYLTLNDVTQIQIICTNLQYH